MTSLFNLILLATSFCFVGAADVFNYTEKIYEQLYRAANLTSVAYCVGPLTPDFIKVGTTFDCELDFCKANEYAYEIVQIFTPSDDCFEFGISGTGYVAISHETKEIILSFRGSFDLQDFISDVELDFVDYKPITTDDTCDGCKVHRGFYNALKTGFHDSLNTIQDLKSNYTDYSVFVTGHSLGGALANLAGIELQLLGYEPLVISMAGPKVGNQKLSDFTNNHFGTDQLDAQFRSGEIKILKKGFWRFIVSQDYVPIVPPGIIYTHSGLEFASDNTLPLPQLKSQIKYSGKYKYENLLSVSWNQILPVDLLHVIQHTHYFIDQGTCIFDLLKYIGIDV